MIKKTCKSKVEFLIRVSSVRITSGVPYKIKGLRVFLGPFFHALCYYVATTFFTCRNKRLFRHLAATLLLVLFLNSGNACAFDKWSKQDLALEATWLTLHAVDCAQTRWMAKHDWKWDGKDWRELDPLMFNDHPNTAQVNMFFAAGALAHVGITHVLPAKYRPYWQGIWIGISGATIHNNEKIGAGLNFSF
jgi:hypothetical protein